jgi:hypothetical protein
VGHVVLRIPSFFFVLRLKFDWTRIMFSLFENHGTGRMLHML